MTALTLPLQVNPKHVCLSDEQFYQLCIDNPDINIERSAEEALISMSPVGGDSGNRELELGTDLTNWNRKYTLGKVFSSSTIFKLPGGGD
jgi:Uma2 family endonuclease